jgi:hypothetical protein
MLAIADEARGQQAVERLERARRANRRILAAMQQLQGLGGELDLANAAGVQLQVDASDIRAGAFGRGRSCGDRPTSGVAPRSMHELCNLAEDVGTDVARMDERRQAAQHGPSDLRIAGDDPRTQPRLSLPRSSVAFVVGLGRVDGHRKRASSTEWAQPQVHPKERAIGPLALEHANEHPQLLVQDEQWASIVARPSRVLRIVEIVGVDEHQIDVAEEVELRAAELAHAEDDDPVGDAEVAQPRLGARCGERGKICADLLERCVLDLASRQTQVLAGADPPEGLVGPVSTHGVFELGDERVVSCGRDERGLEDAASVGNELQQPGRVSTLVQQAAQGARQWPGCEHGIGQPGGAKERTMRVGSARQLAQRGVPRR